MNEEYYTQSDKTSKTISLKISSPFEKKKKKQHAILAILNFQFTNREAAALFPFEITVGTSGRMASDSSRSVKTEVPCRYTIIIMYEVPTI